MKTLLLFGGLLFWAQCVVGIFNVTTIFNNPNCESSGAIQAISESSSSCNFPPECYPFGSIYSYNMACEENAAVLPVQYVETVYSFQECKFDSPHIVFNFTILFDLIVF
jgi:hypothetical protein